MKYSPPIRISALLSIAAVLQSCAASQNAVNTMQMVDVISRIRTDQVIRNLGAFIGDHNSVPSQIVLGTGQANVAVGYQPTLKLTNLNRVAALESDAGLTDQWTAQWQFTAITDPGDLRNLRNLYALVVSSDEEYISLQNILKDGKSDDAVFESLFFHFGGSATVAKPDKTPDQSATAGAEKHGIIIDWKTAKDIITKGDSIGCRQFQQDRDAAGVLPFRRWLYWRSGSGEWHPSIPMGKLTTLGKAKKLELATTSQACFDDFVILVQALSPTTNDAAKQQPHLMLQ
jgi:hypothetical protein